MPKAVYDEVVLKGFAQGYLDSLQVKLALQRQSLAVMKVKIPNAEIEKLPLDKGEKEAIAWRFKIKPTFYLWMICRPGSKQKHLD